MNTKNGQNDNQSDSDNEVSGHSFSFKEMPKEYQDQIAMAILTALVSVIRNKGTLMKFALGKRRADPRLIENLTVRDIFKLLNLPEFQDDLNLINVSVDLDKLYPCLEKMQKEQEEIQQTNNAIIWMLENGATKTMILNTFSHLEKDHLDMWIKVVFKEKQDLYPKIGRARSISNRKTIQCVLDAWHEINKRDISPIEKLKLIKATFPEYNLAILMATINKNWNIDN